MTRVGATSLFVWVPLWLGWLAFTACFSLESPQVASCQITRSLFLFEIVSIVTTSLAFNLDTQQPVIKVGQGQSYFGFSVAQHRTLRTRPYGEALMLIGAPRDDNLQPNTTRSGALWRCPLSSQWKVSTLCA